LPFLSLFKSSKSCLCANIIVFSTYKTHVLQTNSAKEKRCWKTYSCCTYIYISSLFSFQECQRPVCICIPSTAKSMHPKENSCHPLQNQQKISHNRRKFQQHAWVNSLYFSIHLSWQWMHVLRGKATYDISFKACIVAKNGANYLLIKYETWYVTHTFFVHLFLKKKKKKN
jgi:hypothetical protein